MTFASVPAAAQHIARTGAITPHQLAAFSELWESMTDDQKQQFTNTWRAEGSPAALVPSINAHNLQSWFSYFTSEQVKQESKGKIAPLTPDEACGFIGCIIVETGRPNLDRLDVIEAGSGAGRGAMQYTGVRRTAYDKARVAAIAKGVDTNGNRWQQQYFAEEYAGLHDPPQGSLISWTRIFENRPTGMTPAQAAEYWTGSAASRTGYFRPGVPHLDRRQQEAQRVWGLVQSGAIAAPLRLTVSPQQSLAKPLAIDSMTGPAKRPHDFGFKAGDSHLIMNDKSETLTAFSFEGQKLWCISALARGQGADTDWKNYGTDTPPGVYRLGQLYDDVGSANLIPQYTKTLVEYGWQFYDMVELENQEVRHGRSGIGLHGGGSALGWPGAWAPKQKLVPTLGCIRIHNVELRDKIMPLYRRGTVFISVFQETP